MKGIKNRNTTMINNEGRLNFLWYHTSRQWTIENVRNKCNDVSTVFKYAWKSWSLAWYFSGSAWILEIMSSTVGIPSDPSMQPEDVGVNLGSNGNSTVIGSKAAVNSAGEPGHNRSMIWNPYDLRQPIQIEAGSCLVSHRFSTLMDCPWWTSNRSSSLLAASES